MAHAFDLFISYVREDRVIDIAGRPYALLRNLKRTLERCRHPDETSRPFKVCRRKAAEQLVAQEPLGDATTAARLPGVVDGSGYVGSAPPTAPLIEQAGKATWRGRSIDIGSSSAIAPSG